MWEVILKGLLLGAVLGTIVGYYEKKGSPTAKAFHKGLDDVVEVVTGKVSPPSATD